MDAVERRIENAFFNDLFLAISNMEGIQPRNQLDLSQRNEERLIQLGPVLERIHNDFLERMVDRLFNQAVKADILPPPPAVLEGTPLNIRFISTLAMAQRSVVTTDLERMTNFTRNLFALGVQDAWDKVDTDQVQDDYSRAIGVPPATINSDEEVAAVREQRAEQQQQAEALAMAEQAAGTAKNLGAASTEEGNALGDTLAALDEEA